MEIITYVLRGSLEHKDSMGHGRIIHAGEVQYMSAGTGVEHSEFNPSPDEPVHLLQIWIKPARMGVAPRYAEKSLAAAPTGQLLLVASRTGRHGSIAIHQDADIWLAKLAVGNTVRHELEAARRLWVHVAEGEVQINEATLGGGDAAGITVAGALELRGRQPSQVLLFDLS
jgi:redox-sensitive bicupin YhaK (pirin superfamily)